MYQIERTTIISEIMEYAPQTSALFQAIGMQCMGCAMASGENVQEACEEHGVNVDLFVRTINEFLAHQA